ncbi:MAG TPA: FtsX-like permease family protein [Acidimicrobiia bacterium]|jgi:putative ABC transport system permease protein|nr:FtsX-like permease family protein [Acidimicrobiia bacterium]
MDRMFGVPVDSLAVTLSLLVGLGVAILCVLAFRNVVFFRLGVRNANRRRGRSLLIVVGLMLATTIIASALGTGDTMGRTVRFTVLRSLSTQDEWVTVKTAKSTAPVVVGGSTGANLFDQRVFGAIDRALRGSGLVDALAPAIVDTVAIQDSTSRQTEPRIGLFAPDPARMAGLATITSRAGHKITLAGLAPGTVYVDRKAAGKLHARAGDHIVVLAAGHILQLRVAGIVNARGTGTDDGAILMPLAAAQHALGVEGRIKQILISNRGGESTGVARTDGVVQLLRPALSATGLEAEPIKRDGLKAADDAGNAFMQMFTTFGSFSIAAGILLIFLIFVMLAAERRTEMGVARAIGTRRGHLVQTFLFEGTIYDLIAAAIGAALGVAVSFVMVAGVGRAFATSAESLQIVYSIRWQSIVVAYMLGVLLTLVVVALSAWRVSVVNIVTAIRNLPDPRRRARGRRGLIASAAVIGLGALLIISGRSSSQAMPFMLGASLVIVGSVPVLRALRLPDRIAYSVGGVGLVALWLLPFRVIETLVPDATMDFSMWVVGGLIIVVGATWTVIYNADALLGGLTATLGRVRSLTSVLRISGAYPLKTRMRTGMTFAMFTLVVFTLVVGTTTTGAFVSAFGHVDQFSGGFDVRAGTSALSPIHDMASALRHTPGIDARSVRVVAAQSYVPVEVRQAGVGAKYVDYPIRGLDDSYIRNTTYELASRAVGYATDRAVWNAVGTGSQLAIVDANIIPHRRNWNFGSFTDLHLRGFFAEDKTFEPVPLDVRDPETGRTMRVTVIGTLRDNAPFEAAGISTSQRTLAPFGNRALPTIYYLRLAPGTDARHFADRLESAFLANGLVADSYEKVVKDTVAASVLIDRLVLGFMGLGLVVGVAALGVIAARSVVERRQQIGVMRSIGFQASAVRLSFLLESGIMALTSIIVGTALGLAMGYNVIDDASRQSNYGHVPYLVPWAELGVIFTVVMLVALGTTYLPARRASRVYPAEALRYE